MTDRESRPGLLDLEIALAADSDHAKRDEILERLVNEARQLKANLDLGLPRKQAEEAHRLLQALYAAHQVVRAVWRFKHTATR
jgi:hypothetical protein